MKTPRWIEQPRTLAALTLAFALVPVAFAFLTFRSAKERDGKLFETAAEVLGQQLRISTFQPITFLNIMRNQWRGEQTPDAPESALPPKGWQERQPHLLAVAYASHNSDSDIPIRWQEGRIEVLKTGQNLADEPALVEALESARYTRSATSFGVEVGGNRMAIVEAVPSPGNVHVVRGYIIGWLDLMSICEDQKLPLIANQILNVVPYEADGWRVEISGEGESKWTATMTRGPAFSREYGTPTPWIVFAALGLSVLPLSVLVMLAARAGKLRSALETERELGQMKNQFVSSVSHEFRTPLSVILSGAELLESHAGQLSEARRLELLTQIKSSTVRMNEMVEQVLLLGRIESGTMTANPQPVDVAEFCREIVDEVQIATHHRCVIEFESMEGRRALDAALMRSVLVNLLTNAIKYSKPESRVTFAVQVLDQALRFLVSDEGIGIPAAELARMGEPFHRASNVGDISGTGLGLAVVKRCVELCGGTFSIFSEEHSGTQTVVVLPA